MISVTFRKELPPTGDPRDYRTLAIYWWPNPITTFPYYRRDGVQNPESAEFDRPKLGRFVNQVNPLIKAWRTTGRVGLLRTRLHVVGSGFLIPKRG